LQEAVPESVRHRLRAVAYAEFEEQAVRVRFHGGDA
jgi:hypothetical protein